jgi:hypothetical protein
LKLDIAEKFDALYHSTILAMLQRKTIVERLGGHPEHLLEDAPPDLSERANRKKAIADYLKKKHPDRNVR